ncbi:hypothetical protein E2C01_012681 [Portunus trituberculatus]|uniref:Uncharacterized protein n=1 Tax=Portunus trituberculatus TaxID=210409 RepID=A0A5B7DFA3_PORTR|nr:hypothetical protein [Portunus trituberculatus]
MLAGIRRHTQSKTYSHINLVREGTIQAYPEARPVLPTMPSRCPFVPTQAEGIEGCCVRPDVTAVCHLPCPLALQRTSFHFLNPSPSSPSLIPHPFYIHILLSWFPFSRSHKSDRPSIYLCRVSTDSTLLPSILKVIEFRPPAPHVHAISYYLSISSA